ncbi:MAG: hypothetical protein AAFY71_27585 [Bacteroidota bacterium]
MKRTALIIFFLSIMAALSAKDVLMLNNQKLFEGKVKRVDACEIAFKADGDTYIIPVADISFLGFEKEESKQAQKFFDLQQAGESACMEGKGDAKAFHGKVAKHVVSGIIFGPVGTIFALLGNPTPRKGKETKQLSDNRDLFSDAQYLNCYRKEAKKNNVLYTLIGWVVIPAVWALAT